MDKKYNNLKKLKETLLSKIVTRLSLNTEYDPNEEIIEGYMEDAIDAIKVWKNNFSDDIFFGGAYDNNIIMFVIQSYRMNGIEGQLSNSSNGNSRKYDMSPLDVLRSSIPQGL